MSIPIRWLTCLTGLFVLVISPLTADDDKPKSSKPTGTLTSLGTIKGEITKVSDGGNKITVKYKEMVPYSQTTNSGAMTRVGGMTSRFRPPSVKEWGLKEKSQDLDIRVLDKAVIRVLNSKELPGEEKNKGKKKDEANANKEGDQDSDDEAAMKSKGKAASKSTKKSGESALPGKAGDPGSLLKGQVVVVSVMREDFPGYNRLVTGSIYILGEK